MLKDIELQFQLPLMASLFRFIMQEQLIDSVFSHKRAAQNSHYLIDASFKVKISFNNCNSAICDNSYINLYPYSIFAIPPKRFDTQMSFHPLKEGFHSPSVFIQECNVPAFEKEVVGIISKGSLKFRFKVDNSSNLGWVFNSISRGVEPHGLVPEDIIFAFQKVISGHKLKRGPTFFPDNEERVEQLYAIKPAQVPIASIENITGKRFISNPIHSINIMHGSFRDMKRYGYLGRYIKLCVNLDSGFSAPEPGPFKKRHAEINGGGIKGVIPSVELKLFGETLVTGKFYHVIGKFFKNVVITKLIGLGKHAAVYGCLAKTKMVRLFGVCRSNIGQFTKAVASIQLTKHENEQLVPVCQIPAMCSVGINRHDKSFEVSLGKKIGDLAENIFAAVHCTLQLGLPSKVIRSNVRQGFWQSSY